MSVGFRFCKGAAEILTRRALGASGCLLAILAAIGTCPLQAEDWAQFRGPTGMGLTTATNLPTTWGAGSDPNNRENILWQVPLPVKLADGEADHNQSSPVICGGKIFVMTTFWPKGKPHSDYPEQHVTCYRLNDGERLWDTLVPPGPYKLSDMRGGYGAPTPVCDGQRVYVLFGSAMLAALDLDGKIAWQAELAEVEAFDVAISSSPILYRGQLLLLCERYKGKATLNAYNPADGKVLWEMKRPDVTFAHSTPVVMDLGQGAQLLVAASNALQGLDPMSGKILWFMPTPGDVCTPVFAGGMIYTDSGRGGRAIAIEAPRANLDGKELPKESVKWTVGNIPEGLSSPVIVGDFVYRLHNPGVLKCFSLADGKELFAKRLDGISNAASPIATPDKLVYFASAGKSYVIRAGGTYDEVSVNNLGEDANASPAVADGKMILKGRQHLFCIGKK